MNIVDTSIRGAYLLVPTVHLDSRGYFYESYSYRDFVKLGLSDTFVQINRSSSIKNTLRGMHFQRWPRGQVKVVECLHGEIKDVIVDLDPTSPSFLAWESFSLSADNRMQLYIPNSCAHGFLVKSETAEVQYKCSWYYESTLESGYAWNDPVFNIDWGVKDPILSERDQRNLFCNQADLAQR